MLVLIAAVGLINDGVHWKAVFALLSKCMSMKENFIVWGCLMGILSIMFTIGLGLALVNDSYAISRETINNELTKNHKMAY